MTRIIQNTARALVGLDNFHYSVLVLDRPGVIVYDEMVAVPETVELNVNTNSQVSTLFADNKPAIAYTTVGVIEVSLVKATLPNEFLQEVLGSKMVGGVRHVTSTPKAPYVGIAWRQLYSDGNYAYVKLFKGKFTEPENNAKTKEDGVEFQTRTITANFIATSFQETADDAENFSMVMAVCDETDPEYTNEGTTWFNSIMAAPTVTPWQTGHAYLADDLVTNTNKTYVANIAHTADTLFATDLAANKWTEIDYTAPAGS
jgi:phi13 family phage major tail protein